MDVQGKEEDLSSICRKWGEFRRNGSTSNCSLVSRISLGTSRACLAKYGQPYTPFEDISTVGFGRDNDHALLCCVLFLHYHQLLLKKLLLLLFFFK